jgi:predicted AlkP superfamily pyrophosphatase or phosphodiesterase
MRSSVPVWVLLVAASACGQLSPPAVAAPTEPPPVGADAAASAAAPSPSPSPSLSGTPPIADHVVILSEDGLRPDALMQARAPVHQALMRDGAYTMRARTIRQASTLPSHAAMLSGFDVADHGLFWNSWRPERGFIKVPTVFSIAMQAGKDTAAFVGKRKLEHIVQPGSVTLFSRPGYLCPKVVQQAAAYFREHHPQIEFVHFSDPDEEGHSVGWMSEQQIAAVGHTDRCLATLMEALRAPDAGRTLLIISADHGGMGRGHSGVREEDRLIPWIAWGAGVRRGHHIAARVSTVDTAATTLWALGYAPSPGGAGRPVLEAFDEP